jgi:hypothetical protein
LHARGIGALLADQPKHAREQQEMTVDELKARLAVLGLKLPESDHTPLLGMATEIERAALSVRQHHEMTDEMGIIFPTDRMAGGAS